MTVSFPPEACFVLGAAGDATAVDAGGRRARVTVRLDGIDLVIFDKDGTLIDFGTMWSGWAETLADRLGEATGRPVDGPLFAMLGYDPVARRVTAGGGLAATPMARLRERTRDVLVAEGVPAGGRGRRARDRVART